MEVAPDGRLLVCEQGGALGVVKNAVLPTTPLLTVPVIEVNGHGLLGIAFDPGFETSGHVRVYYSSDSSFTNRISRFTVSATDPVVFSGTATDVDDGDLPPGAHGWTILLHHNQKSGPDAHTPPFTGPIEGMTGGAFVIPAEDV